MSTQHSTRPLPSPKESRMKNRPLTKLIPKPIVATTSSHGGAAVSPPKTASSTRSGHPINHHSLPSMAQFTFAPTSTRTVVTTTTTTTTTFPPLVFPPPRSLDDLDPRVHPLAQADTPSSLRSFAFNIDGRPTYFQESDDPEQSLYDVYFRPFGMN
jgi:F-box and WD-40 domain protein CDC4